MAEQRRLKAFDGDSRRVDTDQQRQKTDLPLCEYCKRLTVESLTEGTHLGTLRELKRRSGKCRLCQLVSNTLHHQEPKFSEQHEVRISDVFRSSSSHDKHNRPDNITRITSLNVTSRLTFVVCEIYDGVTWSEAALFRLFALDESQPAIRGIIKGRPILPPNSAQNINRMRKWLSQCSESHSICRKTVSGLRIDSAEMSPLPSRVLYLGTQASPRIQLFASLGRRDSYAALSYCWGTEVEAKPLKTLKANALVFSEGIVAANLPLTIQQAIDVTRILNLKYLWVDSLCIFQDDKDDWRRESQKMGQIYQNATITIAATSAEHCNEGLFLGRAVDEETAKTPFTPGDFVHIPCNAANRVLGEMYISAIPNHDYNHFDFDNEISKSKWKTRGWVVQERILSRRVLHFGRKQLYWECQKSLYAESYSDPIPSDTRLLSKEAMFLRITTDFMLFKRLAQTSYTLDTIHSVICLFKHKLQNILGLDLGIPAEAAMQRSWERIVRSYNLCHLQLETDKLPAIIGLAREMAIMSGQTFHAGVWLEDIARGLYWSAERNEMTYIALKKQHLSGAPSWSWAGWSGPIVMGSFVAEYDTGRPWVSPTTFLAAIQGNSKELELFAHSWTGAVIKKFPSGPYPVSDWKTDAWWKFGPFRVPLDEQMQSFNRVELRIQPNTSSDSTIHGWFVPDDIQRPLHKLSCIVLNTEKVQNSLTDRVGFGYYILVVEETAHLGCYERLGIGIAVSEKDQISHGFFGRSRPKSKLVLV